MRFPTFPMRQIHLDFHTAPEIPDIGADWDADHWIETLTRARVNSVTIFGCCHHGMCYYPSKVATVHPNLEFDLLGAQIEACHRAGIRCPVYLTVAWNVDAARRHPEWQQVDIEGKRVGAKPLEAGWPWLCVNNGYADELIAQTEEIIERYGADEIDGFFYDIVMYHPQGCVCANCLRDLRAAGEDPADPRARRRQNHASSRRFMKRAADVIRGRLGDEAGIFFNSRWGMHFVDEQELYTQVEIESLPTGGWGYGFYPLWSRYGRGFGLPMLGMTGRFHRTWADWGGLKHPHALRFECGGIMATGGAVSVGDQLDPRGRLNGAVYDVIGEAFRHVESVEEYVVGATAETDVALLVLDPDADKANQASAGIVSSAKESIEGAARMLLELHRQFDVVSDRTCPDFGRYKVLVIADRAAPALPDTVERLRRFVANGGKLLLSHEALRDGENFALADEMGVDYAGPARSNPDYFTLTDPALFGPVTRPGFAYSVYDGPAVRVGVRPGTEILADAHDTYFDRTGEHFTSHGYTPARPEKADYPAITRRGGVIYLHGPIFSAYQKYGNLTFRHLVGRCLDLLSPNPVETDAPPTAEVTLNRLPDGRRVAHLVNYSAQRRGPGHVEVLEAPVPLRDVRLTLREAGTVSRVFVAPTGEELPHAVDAFGAVSVTVPRVDAHAVVVFA